MNGYAECLTLSAADTRQNIAGDAECVIWRAVGCATVVEASIYVVTSKSEGINLRSPRPRDDNFAVDLKSDAVGDFVVAREVSRNQTINTKSWIEGGYSELRMRREFRSS